MWILYLDTSWGLPLLQFAEIVKETKKQFKVANSTRYSSIVRKDIPHILVTQEQAQAAYDRANVIKRAHTDTMNKLKEEYNKNIKEVLENASI